MFDFFKKSKEQPEPEQEAEDKTETPFGAQLIYFVDEGEPKVDVSIPDYTKESMENLTILLAGISGSVYFNPTLDLVKEGLIESDQPEALIKMLSILKVIQETKEILGNEDKEEEPCIKPQDAL
jgi:hypothetical protein